MYADIIACHMCKFELNEDCTFILSREGSVLLGGIVIFNMPKVSGLDVRKNEPREENGSVCLPNVEGLSEQTRGRYGKEELGWPSSLCHGKE